MLPGELLLLIGAVAAADPRAGASWTSVNATAAATAGRTLLLVDDHHVLYRAGLTRQLEPLRRTTPGVPVVAPTVRFPLPTPILVSVRFILVPLRD